MKLFLVLCIALSFLVDDQIALSLCDENPKLCAFWAICDENPELCDAWVARPINKRFSLMAKGGKNVFYGNYIICLL